MILLGLIILILILIFAVYYIWKIRVSNRGLLIVCIYALAIGTLCIFNERLTELGFGKLFTAKLKQANKDFGEITNIKENAKEQKTLVDSLVTEIEKSTSRISSLEENTILTEKRLKELDSSFAVELANVRSLSERLRIIKTSSELKLAIVDSTLEQSKRSLQELKLFNDFTTTAVMAQNGDRTAFDKICVWCEDENKDEYPFAEQAVSAWHMIMNYYGKSIFKPAFPLTWPDDINHSTITLEQLIYLYRNSNPLIKPAYIEYICNRDDFTKRSKMEFLILVLKEDDSLLVLQYAGSYFEREAETSKSPILWQEHVKWWEENKDKFE